MSQMTFWERRNDPRARVRNRSPRRSPDHRRVVLAVCAGESVEVLTKGIMMLSRWATEVRCELIHKGAHARTIQIDGHDVCVIWCSECDHIRASQLHGHDISMREDFVASSLQESCEEMADKLADLLPMDKANTVRIIGSRAELAEHNRRKAERRLARWQGLAILSAMAALCLFLSGCKTASKIHRWESALLGWARKGGTECVESAKVASTYLINANRTLQGVTSALDLAADAEAKKLMTEAALKCGEVVP